MTTPFPAGSEYEVSAGDFVYRVLGYAPVARVRIYRGVSLSVRRWPTRTKTALKIVPARLLEPTHRDAREWDRIVSGEVLINGGDADAVLYS